MQTLSIFFFFWLSFSAISDLDFLKDVLLTLFVRKTAERTRAQNVKTGVFMGPTLCQTNLRNSVLTVRLLYSFMSCHVMIQYGRVLI